jgi:hypothetical protein
VPFSWQAFEAKKNKIYSITLRRRRKIVVVVIVLIVRSTRENVTKCFHVWIELQRPGRFVAALRKQGCSRIFRFVSGRADAASRTEGGPRVNSSFGGTFAATLHNPHLNLQTVNGKTDRPKPIMYPQSDSR